MEAIIYNQFGKILRVISAPDDFIDVQVNENEFILKGISADDSKQYVDIDTKTLVDFPKKPNDYSVFNWDSKQWFNDIDLLKSEIDQKRIILLQSSDWTDTVSAQTRLPNYQQWQDYRQALRDIPQQTGYPENVIWPELPQ